MLIRSNLDGGTPTEERLVIHPEGEVLRVPGAAPVSVEDVRVGGGDVAHPLRYGDVDGVADVAAALVEGHDGLQLEPLLLHHLEQLSVGAPLVALGALALDDPPPDIHHDAVDVGRPELLQLLP